MRKHSVSIRGHSTSFSLEDPFWNAFVKLAKRDKLSLAALVTRIDSERDSATNLSSAIRVYVLEEVQKRPLL